MTLVVNPLFNLEGAIFQFVMIGLKYNAGKDCGKESAVYPHYFGNRIFLNLHHDERSLSICIILIAESERPVLQYNHITSVMRFSTQIMLRRHMHSLKV